MDEVQPIRGALREDRVQPPGGVLGDVVLRVVADGRERHGGSEGRAVVPPYLEPSRPVPANRNRPVGPPARRG